MNKQRVIRGAAHFAAPFEGFRSHPYRDGGGTWTYAFGATRDLNGNPVTAATPPITYAKGIILLDDQMTWAYEIVEKHVTAYLNDDQGIAVTDFVFNIGPGEKGVKSGFVTLVNGQPSTLLKYINDNEFEKAAAEFPLWDHIGGVPSNGLLRRRKAEAALFLNGIVPHPTDDWRTAA